jgi:hypothetical protein
VPATLTFDNQALYALLQTPNVRGLCWMLIQHKTQLGLKYIDELSVWEMDQDGTPYYQLYIHIADYDPTVQPGKR